MGKSSALVVLAFLAAVAGCSSVPTPQQRAREAAKLQAKLQRVPLIRNPERRTTAAGDILLQASRWNPHVTIEVLRRFPNLAQSPQWPRLKAEALENANRYGHPEVVRALEAADAEVLRRRQVEHRAAAERQTLERDFAPASKASARASEPSSDVDAPKYRKRERGQDYALVIGVEKYSKIPDASFAERDAQAVKRHLLALGLPERNIASLAGSNATRGAIQGYVEEWLPKNVKPGSTVFVYYSGHGAPDAATSQSFLVPWDGDPKFLQSTAYPLKELYAHLAKLPAKSVVVALDSCFSGAGGRSVIAEGTRPLVTKLDEGLAPGAANLTVLSAASGDETTGTIAEKGHGAFTYYLLKGLSEAAERGSGAVTPRGLYQYLKPKVQDEAHRQNREQTPDLLGSGENELASF